MFYYKIFNKTNGKFHSGKIGYSNPWKNEGKVWTHRPAVKAITNHLTESSRYNPQPLYNRNDIEVIVYGLQEVARETP